MEVEVGKKYRIKNRRGKCWNSEGEMDHWMGKAVTIQKIDGFRSVQIVEDEGENAGRKWNFSEDDFEPIEEMMIEKQFELLKQAWDEFEKAIIEQIEKVEDVFAKSFKEKEEKLYNARIVCIDDCSVSFKKGKIYNVVDGKLEGDYGYTFPIGCRPGEGYNCINDINRDVSSKFIEIVED